MFQGDRLRQRLRQLEKDRTACLSLPARAAEPRPEPRPEPTYPYGGSQVMRTPEWMREELRALS
jgi:hypothetical protein